MRMRKIFRHLHLWLSVPFGLIITLICFSGAMLVFETEITQLCRPDLYYVEEVKAAPLPADRLMEMAAAKLPDGTEATRLTVQADPRRSWQVSLSQPRRASLSIDPYTGEVLGRNERTPFFSVMFRLHRWLLDSARPDGGLFVGKLIVGVSTLLFVVILVSGIVVWWPRNRKALTNSLKIPLRKGTARFRYGLHVAGGMYTLVLLLVMALTGLTWSFSWYRDGVYKIFGADASQNQTHASSANREKDAASESAKEASKNRQTEADGQSRRPGARTTTYAHWQQVYEELSAQNKGFEQITIGDGNASVSWGKWGNQRAADRYSFDPESGEITSITHYKESSRAGKLRGWLYSLHVGSWGGIPTRILYFIAALVGTTLPLTGYYLWIKRLLRRKSGRQ